MTARRKKPVGKVEYRIVCASHTEEGHRSHRYGKPSRARAVATVEEYNAAQADPRYAFQQACFPWAVESRLVAEWGDEFVAEGMQCMLSMLDEGLSVPVEAQLRLGVA